MAKKRMDVNWKREWILNLLRSVSDSTWKIKD
jgi:hypothetical protein